jgi:hypothetical protein
MNLFGYTIISTRDLRALRRSEELLAAQEVTLASLCAQRDSYRKLWQESQERLHKTMGGPQRQVSQPKPDTVREISQRAVESDDARRLRQNVADINDQRIGLSDTKPVPDAYLQPSVLAMHDVGPCDGEGCLGCKQCGGCGGGGD